MKSMLTLLHYAFTYVPSNRRHMMFGFSKELYQAVVQKMPEAKWLHPNRYITYDLSKHIRIASVMYGKNKYGIDKSIYTEEDVFENYHRIHGWKKNTVWNIAVDVTKMMAIGTTRSSARLCKFPGLHDISVLIEDNKDDIEYGLYMNNRKGDARLLYKAKQNHDYEMIGEDDMFYNLKERKLETSESEFLQFLQRLEL